jgi:hypothetical protein
MRIFKNKAFSRFTRKAGLDDAALREAVKNANRGLIDADLGGGVIKQRIARTGEGKSGGFRTIILFRAQQRAVFVYGFEKNERDNIRDDELAQFKELAAIMLAYEDREISTSLSTGALIEVKNDEAVP